MTSTCRSHYPHCCHSLTAGNERYLTIGRNDFTFNQGEISFKYNGNAYGSNALRIGLYGNPSIINILGRDSGCVGINNDNPFATLDVKGDAILGNVYSSNVYTAQSIQCDGNLNVAGSVEIVGDLHTLGANVFIEEDLDVFGYSSFKGADGVASTHFPYTNGKNYIRGETIIADSGGNVGIGTSSPSYKLHCTGTASFEKFRLNSTTFNHIQVYTVSIGSSSNRKSNFTIYGTFPSSGYTVLITPIAENSSITDAFSFVIRGKTSSYIEGTC